MQVGSDSPIAPEAVIVTLNTDVYNLKCMVLLLSLENKHLKARLQQIETAVAGPIVVLAATAT